MVAITFGPVPSRRLGRSLGINNIPPKVCSYSCVYCQVGRTLDLATERRALYPPDEARHHRRPPDARGGGRGPARPHRGGVAAR
jgi:wyosine [tRNA(Phe)-imidazoG37] synthetase (radical SAM superfamily)